GAPCDTGASGQGGRSAAAPRCRRSRAAPASRAPPCWSRAPPPRASCLGAHVGGRGPAAALARALVLAAAAAPALLLRPRLFAHQHALALVRTGVLEALPPLRGFLRRVRRGGTQREEIIGGAEARVLQQPVGTLAAALEEPRLQQPQLLHRRVEAPRDRERLALLVERLVHGVVQRGDRGLPLVLELLQVLLDLAPEQRRQQERGRDGLVAREALVGRPQRGHGERARLGIVERGVEQRQQAVVQLELAQHAYALHRVARQQQLEDLLEEPRMGHVLEEVAQLPDRLARLGVDREPELRAQARRAQHAHRV